MTNATLGLLAVSLLVCLARASASTPDWGVARPTPASDSVLSGVHSVVLQTIRDGRQPVLVFDLDGTLFVTGARHKRIMLEFGLRHARQFPGLARAVRRWVPEEQPYLIEDTFERLGIVSREDQKHAMDFWADRFFTNEYLEADTPLPGALGYVRALQGSGAHIVYLTGRKVTQQRAGTLKVLRMNGFPVPPQRCTLLMNPSTGLHDTTFKGSDPVRDQITALGQVVAIFDNEPGNVNVLKRSFPRALTVFLDTNHSPGAPAVETGIPWIRNFRWSRLGTHTGTRSP